MNYTLTEKYILTNVSSHHGDPQLVVVDEQCCAEMISVSLGASDGRPWGEFK